MSQSLKKIDYPQCARDALPKIESLVISRKNQDHCLELIAEYVFLEKKVRKDFSNNIYLTLIQEFQLVVVLAEYFSRPGPDATRNAVFLSLFGGSAITFSRSRVLVKLISTAVSGSIESVLCASGTWMQQLGPTSTASLDLVNCLIDDFVKFSKNGAQQLKSLPLIAPRFAVNFMTSVAELYLNDKTNMILPPDILLELFTEWISDNPILCLASQPPLSLPAGAISMPVMTPLAGLIRWCVLAPLVLTKNAYSKLHLALLESLNQTPIAPGVPAALNTLHLVLIVNLLKYKSEQIMEQNRRPEDDECLQTSLERFAQAIQLALSSRALSGNLTQFLCRLETLPANVLLRLVIKSNKNTVL